MEEGLIVSDCTAESFTSTVETALHLNWEQRTNMKTNARICAENNFDYKAYSEEINKLTDLKGNI
ncbi:MAG: hypothetical protein WCO98_14095 [bacterium]